MVQELSAKLTALSKYGNEDYEWVLFVQDHKSYLLKNSTKLYISKIDMFDCKYRPEEFIVKQKLDVSSTWIVLWLNQIDYNNFTDLSELWIPSSSTISKLRSQYEIIQKKKQKLVDNSSV